MNINQNPGIDMVVGEFRYNHHEAVLDRLSMLAAPWL